MQGEFHGASVFKPQETLFIAIDTQPKVNPGNWHIIPQMSHDTLRLGELVFRIHSRHKFHNIRPSGLLTAEDIQRFFIGRRAVEQVLK